MKDLGVTFLMPVGGGNYLNLSEKIDITYKSMENSEPMKVGDITTKHTRPFIIPKTFSGSEKVSVSDNNGKTLCGLNWLNQEQNITPLAVLPNGRGKLIISTVSLDKFPDMVGIIMEILKDSLNDS